ncbi:uncharacterized protein AMSG_09901 [Thecamonas trahens ATCC 50062]|uniref:C2 domain-containing protein n=1 Tax=Thecamonas trahens ATCC 50062 TaxID=461836 RepID=A0A0L0DPE0_THETB|nr:hypothetical protein AMSG_09901 [Thecamonas trahens ATCC 50062]KNC54125.1 hypothetical protein AMSG_09901 [Thecamonas trahens ATCC 50062]|eukprot:XP_013753947.1 hypothetical protein AMSG_09901 [Thecamonas trahens ATCC 50062]
MASGCGYTGVITIDVHEARNLLSGDVTMSSDPYVVIRVGDQKVETDVVRMSKSPTWNAHFELHASNDGLLRFEVWDKDTATSDDALGLLDIPLSQHMSNQDGWCRLDRHPKLDAANIPARIKHLAGAIMDGEMVYGDIRLTIAFDGAHGPTVPITGGGGGAGRGSSGGDYFGGGGSGESGPGSGSGSYSYSSESANGSKRRGRRKRGGGRGRGRGRGKGKNGKRGSGSNSSSGSGSS